MKSASGLQRPPHTSLGWVARIKQSTDSFRVKYEAHSASPELRWLLRGTAQQAHEPIDLCMIFGGV